MMVRAWAVATGGPCGSIAGQQHWTNLIGPGNVHFSMPRFIRRAASSSGRAGDF